MSHPENSKNAVATQLLIRSCPSFANMGHGDLLKVQGNVPVHEALILARTLSEGLRCIQERLGDLVDQGVELTYFDELRTLEFVSEVVGALILAAQGSLIPAGGEQ